MRIFVAICLAAPLFAQSDPRVRHIVDDWMKQRPALTAQPQPPLPVKTLTGVVPQSTKPCSVPLIEMQIPDVHFTMQQVQPLKEAVDNMQINPPAPSCASR